MFPNLGEDLRRYGNPRQQIKALLLAPRVWAIVAYRFAHWVHTAPMPAIVRWPLKMLVRLIYVFIEIATNIELPAQTVVGCGLFVPHTGHIIIASNATIGRYCTFTQGISVGHGAGGRESSFASPVVGDRVYIGPGAAVLGPINIGNDVLIGANAVVIRSVPARAVVVGNPARVISMKGSFDLVKYDGMDRDGQRIASLAAGSSETKDQTTIDHE